jgi:hypothetical protein
VRHVEFFSSSRVMFSIVVEYKSTLRIYRREFCLVAVATCRYWMMWARGEAGCAAASAMNQWERDVVDQNITR